MAKYLLLKHYRGAPAPVNDVPMDRWTPEEVEAHFAFMREFAERLGIELTPRLEWISSQRVDRQIAEFRVIVRGDFFC